MANIFGILTACVVAVSLWVGYKNNVEFDKQVKLHEKAEKKLNAVQEDNRVLLEKIAGEEGIQTSLTSNTEEAKSQLATLVEENESLSQKKDRVTSDETRVSETIAKTTDVLESLPDADVLIPQFQAIQKDIAQTKIDIADQENEVVELESEIQGTSAQVAVQKEISEIRSSGKSLPDLSTTVQSVYRNWGFVTLGGGNAQGVVSGSTLDVIRNGEVVAKLKVTAVEQNRAAADILVDALPVVVALRSGDKVVAAQ